MKQQDGKWTHMTLFKFEVPEEESNNKIKCNTKINHKQASKAKHSTMSAPGVKYQTLITDLSIMPLTRVKDLMKSESKVDFIIEPHIERPQTAKQIKQCEESKIKADMILEKSKNLSRPKSAKVSMLESKRLQPNHPKPHNRRNDEISIPKASDEIGLSELLFNQKVEKPTMDFFADLSYKKFHKNFSNNRPLSAGGNVLETYKKNQAKTLKELRTQQKYIPKATALVSK